VSSSYDLSSSYTLSSSNASTASYVNLLAGPNVTINYQNNGIAISSSGGGGSGIPGGNPNQIQFNSSSVFAGATGFNYITGSSNTLQFTGSFTVSSSLNTIGTSRTTGSLIVSNSLNVIGTSLVTGSLIVSSSLRVLGTASFTGSLGLSGSAALQGSGSSILLVGGTVGPLLIVNDSISGSLFSVNDSSGLSIVDVRSDASVLMGSSNAVSLTSTKKVVSIGAGPFTLGGILIPTASYDGAFFEYIAKSGSNARSGYITATWSGSTIVSSSITSSNIGDTSGLTTFAAISSSYIVLSGSANAANWTVKSIIRAI
jgi:hypothetical protein